MSDSSLVFLDKNRQSSARKNEGESGATSSDSLYNFDAEQSLLALLLWSNSLYEKISDIVDKDYFGNAAHRDLFDRMVYLLNKGKMVDKIVLKGFADSHPSIQDEGGSQYVADLVDRLEAERKAREEAEREVAMLRSRVLEQAAFAEQQFQRAEAAEARLRELNKP